MSKYAKDLVVGDVVACLRGTMELTANPKPVVYMGVNVVKIVARFNDTTVIRHWKPYTKIATKS